MRIKIDAETYYSEFQLRIMGLDGEALERARDSKQLRYKMVGKDVTYKGAWLIAWLDRTEEVAAR